MYLRRRETWEMKSNGRGASRERGVICGKTKRSMKEESILLKRRER
jgi:hypothetical protein